VLFLVLPKEHIARCPTVRIVQRERSQDLTHIFLLVNASLKRLNNKDRKQMLSIFVMERDALASLSLGTASSIIVRAIAIKR
jgi:hypothetical protein